MLVNAVSELEAERESLTERVERQGDRIEGQRAAIADLEGRFDELATAVEDS